MAAGRARQGHRHDDGDDPRRSRRAQRRPRRVLLRALADRGRRRSGRRNDRRAARARRVYEGRLPPPKGAPVEDWEDREQTLFRSTAFGDDVDRPLKKSDGSYTYFASDIAYHRSKFERGFRHADRRLGRRSRRLHQAHAGGGGGGERPARPTLDVKIIQLVKLLRAGEPVKMSKRSGDFVTLREVVDEVGRDAVRFMMLFRKNDAVLDFDLAKVIEQSRDNPVFYVQYGHARGQSMFRNAREAFPDLPDDDRAAWLTARRPRAACRPRRTRPDAANCPLSAGRGSGGAGP